MDLVAREEGDLAPVEDLERGDRARVRERVVAGSAGAIVASAEVVVSSASLIASVVIFSISSSSVFGAGRDLRLREVARRVEGGGGDSAVCLEDVTDMGVAGDRLELLVGLDGSPGNAFG